WVISLRQKQKKLIMLPSETMIWQPEFTDKTLSRKTGAVQVVVDLHYQEAFWLRFWCFVRMFCGSFSLLTFLVVHVVFKSIRCS
ncbi:hypothetical protein, partial [Escherichia coli]|uniref:hypothetical protein n=1 Tax=Escherichia coli TaxID=562 RepID=UPI001981D780